MPQPDLAAAVARVLESALASSGFGITGASSTIVTLESDRSALRLSYNREDLPRPWLSVTIGVRDAPGNPPPLVALWRAFPDEHELQDPDLLSFSNQGELEERLVRIRDDWFPRFVIPALTSKTRLPTALMDQERELLVEHEGQKHEQHLRNARSLFDGEDYQGAVEAYVLGGVDTLSAADRRRLAIARRHLSDGRAT